jgi:hypothetical protein
MVLTFLRITKSRYCAANTAGCVSFLLFILGQPPFFRKREKLSKMLQSL